jgi:hypothetical protein
MKAAIVSLFGFLVGAVLGSVTVGAALYVFPFDHLSRTARVLASTKVEKGDESVFLRVLGDAIAGTHGGKFPFKPFPEGIKMLAGPNLGDGFAFLTKTRNAAEEISGFATELEVASPESSFLGGRIMTDTYWTVVLPGRGTLFLYQTENNWKLVKDVFLPMLLTRRDWSGEWLNVNTFGPRPDGRGIIVGGTGKFAGRGGTFLEIGRLRSATLAGELGGILELRLFFEPTKVTTKRAAPRRG